MCHAIPCAQGGDGVWPVAVSLSQAGGQLVGVRCTTAQPFPPRAAAPLQPVLRAAATHGGAGW